CELADGDLVVVGGPAVRQRDGARAGHRVRDHERADVLRDPGGIEAPSGDRLGHYTSHEIQAGYGQGGPGQAGDLDELSGSVINVLLASGKPWEISRLPIYSNTSGTLPAFRWSLL